MVDHAEVSDANLQRVREVVTAITGLTPPTLGDDVPFTQLGMDSLTLTQVAGGLTRSLGLRVTLRQLMTSATSVRAVGALLPAAAAPARSGAADRRDASSDATNGSVPPYASSARDASSLGAESAALAPDLRRLFEQQLAIMSAQLDAIAAAPRTSSAIVREADATSAPSVPAPSPTPTPSPTLTPAPTRSPAPRWNGPLVLTPHQRKHLDLLIADYTAKTPTSKQLVDRWRATHADPRTASGFHPLWKEMTYPLVVDRSKGAMLWDVDDNAYVDLLNGFGPGLLGHSHPAITDAIAQQLSRGFEVGPLSPLAGEAAELVCRLTGMERATFVCTGSEAVQAAIRAARTHTSRDTLVTFTTDYHGNFDEVLVRASPSGDRLQSVPSAPGIPLRATADVVVLEYGTEASLEIIRRLGDRVAGVLVEPVQSRRPHWQPREFLHALRDLTREIGAVLIFDEVVTGFRLALGGAQAFYGVEADLATYGKVLGGGMPVGVVAGRRPFMDVFDGGPWQFGDASGPEAGVTFFAGTFVRHPLVLASVVATLRLLEAEGPALQQRLNQRADGFVATVQRDLADLGMSHQITNCGSLSYIRSTAGHPFETLLFHALRLEGVHVLDGFPSYLTIAHDDDTLATVRAALQRAAGRLLDGALVPASVS
jgi:glutamate-1-semialdehyde aminotransferase